MNVFSIAVGLSPCIPKRDLVVKCLELAFSEVNNPENDFIDTEKYIIKMKLVEPVTCEDSDMTSIMFNVVNEPDIIGVVALAELAKVDILAEAESIFSVFPLPIISGSVLPDPFYHFDGFYPILPDTDTVVTGMAKFVEKLQLTRVSILSGPTAYGRYTIRSLQKALDATDTQVASASSTSMMGSDGDAWYNTEYSYYDAELDRIIESKSKIILMHETPESMKKIFYVAYHKGMIGPNNDLTWILGSHFCENLTEDLNDVDLYGIEDSLVEMIQASMKYSVCVQPTITIDDDWLYGKWHTFPSIESQEFSNEPLPPTIPFHYDSVLWMAKTFNAATSIKNCASWIPCMKEVAETMNLGDYANSTKMAAKTYTNGLTSVYNYLPNMNNDLNWKLVAHFDNSTNSLESFDLDALTFNDEGTLPTAFECANNCNSVYDWPVFLSIAVCVILLIGINLLTILESEARKKVSMVFGKSHLHIWSILIAIHMIIEGSEIFAFKNGCGTQILSRNVCQAQSGTIHMIRFILGILLILRVRRFYNVLKDYRMVKKRLLGRKEVLFIIVVFCFLVVSLMNDLLDARIMTFQSSTSPDRYYNLCSVDYNQFDPSVDTFVWNFLARSTFGLVILSYLIRLCWLIHKCCSKKSRVAFKIHWRTMSFCFVMVIVVYLCWMLFLKSATTFVGKSTYSTIETPANKTSTSELASQSSNFLGSTNPYEGFFDNNDLLFDVDVYEHLILGRFFVYALMSFLACFPIIQQEVQFFLFVRKQRKRAGKKSRRPTLQTIYHKRQRGDRLKEWIGTLQGPDNAPSLGAVLRPQLCDEGSHQEKRYEFVLQWLKNIKTRKQPNDSYGSDMIVDPENDMVRNDNRRNSLSSNNSSMAEDLGEGIVVVSPFSPECKHRYRFCLTPCDDPVIPKMSSSSNNNNKLYKRSSRIKASSPEKQQDQCGKSNGRNSENNENDDQEDNSDMFDGNEEVDVFNGCQIGNDSSGKRDNNCHDGQASFHEATVSGIAKDFVENEKNKREFDGIIDGGNDDGSEEDNYSFDDEDAILRNMAYNGITKTQTTTHSISDDEKYDSDPHGVSHPTKFTLSIQLYDPILHNGYGSQRIQSSISCGTATMSSNGPLTPPMMQFGGPYAAVCGLRTPNYKSTSFGSPSSALPNDFHQLPISGGFGSEIETPTTPSSVCPLIALPPQLKSRQSMIPNPPTPPRKRPKSLPRFGIRRSSSISPVSNFYAVDENNKVIVQREEPEKDFMRRVRSCRVTDRKKRLLGDRSSIKDEFPELPSLLLGLSSKYDPNSHSMSSSRPQRISSLVQSTVSNAAIDISVLNSMTARHVANSVIKQDNQSPVKAEALCSSSDDSSSCSSISAITCYGDRSQLFFKKKNSYGIKHEKRNTEYHREDDDSELLSLKPNQAEKENDTSDINHKHNKTKANNNTGTIPPNRKRSYSSDCPISSMNQKPLKTCLKVTINNNNSKNLSEEINDQQFHHHQLSPSISQKMFRNPRLSSSKFKSQNSMPKGLDNSASVKKIFRGGFDCSNNNNNNNNIDVESRVTIKHDDPCARQSMESLPSPPNTIAPNVLPPLNSSLSPNQNDFVVEYDDEISSEMGDDDGDLHSPVPVCLQSVLTNDIASQPIGNSISSHVSQTNQSILNSQKKGFSFFVKFDTDECFSSGSFLKSFLRKNCASKGAAVKKLQHELGLLSLAYSHISEFLNSTGRDVDALLDTFETVSWAHNREMKLKQKQNKR
eukprot:TRINITY_DN2067_c0_g1_i2.p1 TRINITY_DN2067_c0_g1~~TRINITY_DN2067_c0_g1_i2.p1  ORF type:complete len:1737 (-),score=395.28 TRINITY_DN2067_c0_g1_i2:348-5558(-)